MKKIIIFLGGAALIFLFSGITWSLCAETLICVRNRGQTTAMHVAAELIIIEAFQKIGITCKVEYLPGERALSITNSGEADVEILRVKGIDSKYPNLMWIPVSTVSADQMAWSKKNIDVSNGWESLRPYRLGVVRGHKIAENNTQGMNRQVVSTWQQAFELVNIDRVEIGIVGRATGVLIVRDLGLKDVRCLEPPLEITPLYPYLHKKHADLHPKITATLEDMSGKGRFKEILDQETEKLKKGEGVYAR